MSSFVFLSWAVEYRIQAAEWADIEVYSTQREGVSHLTTSSKIQH